VRLPAGCDIFVAFRNEQNKSVLAWHLRRRVACGPARTFTTFVSIVDSHLHKFVSDMAVQKRVPKIRLALAANSPQ
jgi:hypothetical protein